jgi:pimeloyl-ACP methyl ester carboxylesterase
MGGYALLHMLVNHPNKVRAAAFVSTRASADDPSKAEGRIRQMSFVRDEGAEAFAATLVPNIFSAPFAGAHPEVVEATRLVIAAQEPDNIALRAGAMRQRVDMTPRLSEITCPCAVIGGDEDRIVSPHAMKELHEGLPDSTFEMIEGVGHMSPLEAPDRVGFCLGQLMQRAGMWM